MYYELDFTDRRQGLYTLHERDGELLAEGVANIKPGTLLVTDPDLEAYAGLVDSKFYVDYTSITLELVQQGRMSVDAVKATKHLCLFDRWEIPVLLKKVRPTCFEFSFSGGRLYTVRFGLGEPIK